MVSAGSARLKLVFHHFSPHLERTGPVRFLFLRKKPQEGLPSCGFVSQCFFFRITTMPMIAATAMTPSSTHSHVSPALC